MKNLYILITIIILLILPFLSACQPAIPTEEGQSADDIVPAPGLGPQYRANINQQGMKNPWPPVEVKEVTIGESPDIVKITYRDYIETKAGQTRNNMFAIYLPNVDPSDTSLEDIKTVLKGVDLPHGITVTQDDWEWHGADPTRRSKTAVIIEISPQVKPGEYTIDIGIEITGRDYGTLPCTINIIE